MYNTSGCMILPTAISACTTPSLSATFFNTIPESVRRVGASGRASETCILFKMIRRWQPKRHHRTVCRRPTER